MRLWFNRCTSYTLCSHQTQRSHNTKKFQNGICFIPGSCCRCFTGLLHFHLHPAVSACPNVLRGKEVRIDRSSSRVGFLRLIRVRCSSCLQTRCSSSFLLSSSSHNQPHPFESHFIVCSFQGGAFSKLHFTFQILWHFQNQLTYSKIRLASLAKTLCTLGNKNLAH